MTFDGRVAIGLVNINDGGTVTYQESVDDPVHLDQRPWTSGCSPLICSHFPTSRGGAP